MDEIRVMSYEELTEAAKDTGRETVVFIESPMEGTLCRGTIVPGLEPPEHGFNYPGGVDFNAVNDLGDIFDGDFYEMLDIDDEPHVLAWRAWNHMPTEEQRERTAWEMPRRGKNDDDGRSS